MFIGNKGEIFKAEDVAEKIWHFNTEGLHEDLKQTLYYIITDKMIGYTADEIAEEWHTDKRQIRFLINELDRLGVIWLGFENRVFFDFESFSMLQFPKGGVW